MSMIIIALACSILFAMGYYLGNQWGRTAQIRDEIRQARENRVVARITNH